MQCPVNLMGKITWKIQKAPKPLSTGQLTKFPLLNNESSLGYGAHHLCKTSPSLPFHMSSLVALVHRAILFGTLED